MTCTDVRARLALLLSGDLPAAEVDEIRQHLTRCPSCREERTAIAQLRHLLDAVPAPAAVVNLSRLYRDAAEGQARRLRRWRAATVAVLSAAAAVVAVLLLSRMEIRMDAHQLVVRWGAVPAPDPVPPPAPPREERPTVPPPVVATAEVEQQLGLLRELVQAVSNGADLRDERRQQEIAELRGRMRGLEQQMRQLRVASERDLSALYAAQLPDKQKGASQ
jgi:hypothetical protein